MHEGLIPSPLPLSCDLYLEWGHATRFAFVFQDSRSIGLLIQWRSLEDAGRAAELVARDPLGIRVSPMYRGGSEGGKSWKLQLIWALTVPIALLDAFLAAVESFAEKIELAAPVTKSEQVFVNAMPTPSKSEVLAAVLDDGCAFANERFRQGGGTRIIWLWDQNPGSRGAKGFLSYGGQFTKADLDNFYPGIYQTQEEAYRAAGLKGLRRGASHGAHVTDLLIGREEWEIVFVQFPKAGVDDPSGLWLRRNALDGLHFVVDCAGPATKTIVANLSWGPQTGRHDGTSLLETAIKNLIADQNALPKPRTLIVSLPAGNSFGSQSHACIDYAHGGEFEWVVPPDGQIPAFVELWWPAGVAVDDVKLSITPPVGPAVIVAAGSYFAPGKSWWVGLKMIGPYAKALVIVHPTSGPSATAAAGPHGRWKIVIAPTFSDICDDVHVYVARADHNMGARRRATPSYLTDAPLEGGRYVAPTARFNDIGASVIRRAGTLNGIATEASTYTASGYVHQPLGGSPYSAYSSSGPTRGGVDKPNYACVTDRSPARPGVRATGVRTGTSVLLIGTSTAAPQLARRLVTGLGAVTQPIPYKKVRIGVGCLAPDPWLVRPT